MVVHLVRAPARPLCAAEAEAMLGGAGGDAGGDAGRRSASSAVDEARARDSTPTPAAEREQQASPRGARGGVATGGAATDSATS